ncbi:MAG: hypothetical protein JKX97_04985 [Candidatus Lindowbacteria bacterium]|nr:hypothetical protein [Candidatus Lindowbacteria bacterium]
MIGIVVGISFVFLIFAIYIFMKSYVPVHVDRPLVRACPVCGSELKKGENIMAERTGMHRNNREKIIIRGCHRCLKAQGGEQARMADYLNISKEPEKPNKIVGVAN